MNSRGVSRGGKKDVAARAVTCGRTTPDATEAARDLACRALREAGKLSKLVFEYVDAPRPAGK